MTNLSWPTFSIQRGAPCYQGVVLGPLNVLDSGSSA